MKQLLKTIAALAAGALMLGATMVGGATTALDLKDYPAPFVTGGTYDATTTYVVGENAAASDTLGLVDITTGLQFESKECKAGQTGATGKGYEKIGLGDPLANPQAFDAELDRSTLPFFWKGQIAFKGSTYDTKEQLNLANGDRNVKIGTGLTSSDEKFADKIVMLIDAGAVQYNYMFTDTIPLNKTTSTDPLEIKFLGKTIKITEVSDNKITANVGQEFFMDVGDAVEVDGKKVTLVNVGEGGSIVIDVDGVVSVISQGTPKIINGIEVKVDNTFYETVKTSRSASLIIGKEAVQSYSDGDAFVGENKDNPDWVWVLDNLESGLSSDDVNGPKFGIKNDFTWNDESDNPPVVGECIDLPNNYIKICMDSLTVPDEDYKEYTLEIDEHADLSKVVESATSAQTLYLHTSQSEGFVIRNDLFEKIGQATPKTDKVWLWKCSTDDNKLGVYYKDSDGKTQIAGCVDAVGGTFDKTQIAEINYENTKGSDIPIYVEGISSTKLKLTTDAMGGDMVVHNDQLTSTWTHNSGKFEFTALGANANTEEADELTWTGTGSPIQTINIGTKDDALRSRYGIIIKNPSNEGSNDQVVMQIPSDQVQANVVISSVDQNTGTTTNEICSMTEITPITKLDSELDATNKNIILVGGPCANSAVEALFGIKCSEWSLKPGEGLIKLVANGNKVALLVAGTTAYDSRMVAKVVANYKDYTLSGQEALVRGTSLTDITVE